MVTFVQNADVCCTVAMADRGERMMFAARVWYGREKYDVDEEYFALRGLCVAKEKSGHGHRRHVDARALRQHLLQLHHLQHVERQDLVGESHDLGRAKRRYHNESLWFPVNNEEA